MRENFKKNDILILFLPTFDLLLLFLDIHNNMRFALSIPKSPNSESKNFARISARYTVEYKKKTYKGDEIIQISLLQTRCDQIDLSDSLLYRHETVFVIANTKKRVNYHIELLLWR